MRGLLVILGVLVSFPAVAQVYSPDFDCSRAGPTDSIALMLCQNSDAAKAELEFDQAYYALRQNVGKQGWKALKQEAIADDEIFKECLSPTETTAPNNIPVADPACYISHMDGLTTKYRSRLTGAALEEASRPILVHRILQQKLADLGYLPTGTIADGVYGEATRQAIETWQRVAKRPDISGFLSDADAKSLLDDVPQGATEDDQIKAAATSGMAAAVDPTATPPMSVTEPDRTISPKFAPSHKDSGLSPMQWSIIVIAIVLGVSFYILPITIAYKRGVHNIITVALINLLFGWTFIGWCAALIMACSMERNLEYDLRMRAMLHMSGNGK